MKQRIILTLAIVLFGLFTAYTPLIIYGLQQAKGQFKIIQNKVPISEVIKDTILSEDQIEKLHLIQDIKDFAFSELGLIDLNQYQYFYDQKGTPGMFIVTACEPFSLEPYEWKAGFLGKFSYKGFFSKAKAAKQEKVWKALGYDTDIGITNAWSTLGWFEDPIMSNFLERPPGELARVIIHELTHGTLFVKNDLNFNENLATFIGDIGAEKFLIYRFGKGSEELIEYQNFLSDRIIFKTFMLNQAESLKQFYAEIHDLPDADKIKQKEGELKKITEQSKLLSFKNPERYRWLTNPKELPNNTLFTDFLTYNSDNQKLDSLFYKNYNGNIAKMIEGLKEQYSK